MPPPAIGAPAGAQFSAGTSAPNTAPLTAPPSIAASAAPPSAPNSNGASVPPPATAALAAAVATADVDSASKRLDFTDEDLRVLDDLERLADGAEPELVSEKVRPARMIASLIRLLIHKGVIHEHEFLEELGRK